MIIYLEGADASGKSTLRHKIVEQLYATVDEWTEFGIIGIVENGEELIPTRPTNPKRLNLEDLFRKLWEMAFDLKTIYICDRGPISDIIYRTFDKFQPVMTLNQYVNFWIKAHRLIVTVWCDSDVSTEMLHERGDNNPIAVANHAAIRYLYKQIMPIFKPVKYDFAKVTDGGQGKIDIILMNLYNGLYLATEEAKKAELK